MKKLFSIAALALAFIVFAAPFAGVSAQDQAITITEAQVNSSYRVTHPRLRSVTDVSVDLQPGQAVINAVLTVRTRSGRNIQTNTYAISSVWTPYISSGRIYWTLESATANGAPASAEIINQINLAVATSWRSYVRGQTEGRVTGITITDGEIQITWA